MLERLLAGLSVLVIEDEYYLADELSNAVRAAGGAVLGPVPSIEAALDLLGHEANPDAAVLDVNLGGEMAYPVADALLSRGVPFLFTTGYDQAALPRRYATVPRMEKPVETSMLLRELRLLIDGSAQV